MENSTQAQINASEQTVKNPLTAKERAMFVDDFETFASAAAIVGLIGSQALPRPLLEKAFSAATHAMIAAKVLIMHYVENDAEVMAIINAENEKRKAQQGELQNKTKAGF